ncbi:hypothetical protein CLOM_g15218 [Closterium sp. NIES-68]|nr:hypothetical protein CLOM_g15218 [Closterium sp. NIES-68]
MKEDFDVDLSARCSRLPAAQLTAQAAPPNTASAAQGQTLREAPLHCPRDHSLPFSWPQPCAHVDACMPCRACDSTTSSCDNPSIRRFRSLRGVKQRQKWWRGAGGRGSRWMVERWRGVMPRLSLATLLLSLLHRLVTLSAAAAALSASAVRINCGGSERLVGGDGRVWEADAFFVGGQAAVLASMPLALSPELRSQRVFHARDVSCYDIPLATGRFIVRLAFAFHSDQLPSAQRDLSPPLTVLSDEGVSASSLSASNALTPDAVGRDTTDSSVPRQPTADSSAPADTATPHAVASDAVGAEADGGDVSAGPLDEDVMAGDGAVPGLHDGQAAGTSSNDKHKARWPRFAVVVEGVQMETVSMAQHVGAVYVPEYIVDSADASLTLCFLPVWGHALVNTIEVLPVPASFYLLPPVVPPNAFLALRARIDCGSAASKLSIGTEAPSQAVAEGAGGGPSPLTTTEGVAGDAWAGSSTGAARASDRFNHSLAASVLAKAPDGHGRMDAMGRRWVSDLSQIVSNHEQAASNGLSSASGNTSRSAVAPPKSLHSALPVNGAGQAPVFLPQALLQSAREAVLASGLHYSFSFRIPARLNRWVVLLHFVALQPESRVGERVFDIHVNGVTVRGFDILREAKGLHNRLVTLPVVVGFSRPAIGSAPTLEVQLVARNGSKFSPLVSSIEVIEVVRANVPRENVVSELQAQQKTSGSQAAPTPSPSHPSHAGVVAGAIGGAGALVFLVLMVPLLLLWRHQHRRRHAAVRSQLLDENALDSAAVQVDEGLDGPEQGGVVEEVDALVVSREGFEDLD